MILPQNIIKQHLCNIPAFIISANVLFSRFTLQIDWIFKKANIIVVTDENIGVYLMFQVHLFEASKVKFLKKKRIKTKASPEEQKQHVKSKRPHISVFT